MLFQFHRAWNLEKKCNSIKSKGVSRVKWNTFLWYNMPNMKHGIKGNNMGKSLFIIGNGFDCYAHKMKTRYCDFKEYLKEKYPDYDVEFDGFLEVTTMPDGELVYDMDEVVGSIIRLMDDCADNDWNTLEACVGQTYIESIISDNEWCLNYIDWENDSTKSIRRSVYNNEDLARNISGAYYEIKKLFEQWVFEVLGKIDYEKVHRIKKPSFKHSLFLNFNYTHTLEKVYKVNTQSICHIHGDAEDKQSEIYFGHGESSSLEEMDYYFGIREYFEQLIGDMKKDTAKAIDQHLDFFKSLSEVNKIYSYGFSFSDVDKCYLDEIAKNVNPKRVRWYFGEHDWKREKWKIDIVKEYGFKVRRSYRW